MNRSAPYIMLRVLTLCFVWGGAAISGSLYFNFQARANQIAALKSYGIPNRDTGRQFSAAEEDANLSGNVAIGFAVVGVAVSAYWGYRRWQSFRF